MIRVNFICHGNICRSPMAKYIFKDMIEKRGIAGDFIVDSCATSYEEIGNPVYPPARAELAEGIKKATFHTPICPVYQNVTAKPSTDPDEIKANLLTQLTAPVRWTQSVQNMVADGATHFIEIGPGKVLQGLIAKIAGSDVTVEGFQTAEM